MTPKLKKRLIRIIAAVILFAALMVITKLNLFGIEDNKILCLCLFLVPYLIAGYDVLLKSFKNISKGNVFDENFLMMVASIAAFCIGEYEEACAVMIFYQVGEWFQDYAVGKSRKSIADMLDIAPKSANLMENGEITEVDPDDVEVGSILVVRPGECVPIDGIIESGETFADTSAITGESVPRRFAKGDEIYSGIINGESTITIKTTKEYDDSTVAKILELVENAADKKADVEQFITRFAKYYTPIVTIAALLLAIVPSLITGDFATWIYRACTFLVVSCPCALVISVPLGFFGGIGAASKNGILVKGSNYLELVSKADTIVFDKTGTLTKGVFEVNRILPENGFSEEQILSIMAAVEKHSTHPIGEALVREAKNRNIDEITSVSGTLEIPGQGLKAVVDGKTVLCGNDKLLKAENIDYTPSDSPDTKVYLASEGKYAGVVIISDSIKDTAKDDIKSLRQSGIDKAYMLSGDNREIAEEIANQAGLDGAIGNLLPTDKVTKLEELMDKTDGLVIYAGDGINDAPVITRADIGVAMGSMGSDAAIEAADIVLMDDNIGKLSKLMNISRKTLRIVKENIVFALAVKLAVLILGAFGVVNMWAAVFADVGVAIIAILNSMRCLKAKKNGFVSKKV